jgi:FkbM family methyltransferase
LGFIFAQNIMLHEMEELIKAVKFGESSRFRKLFKIPHRAFYVKLLKIAKTTKGVNARTFWNSNMKVFLPEVVSSRIYKFGYFDEDVCVFLLEGLKPGMTFVDIGSHFGFFSLLANHLVGKGGRVISIDPTPSTFQVLIENLRTNAEHENYTTHNIAAFDENTSLSFFDYGVSNSGYNSLVGARLKSIDGSGASIKVRALKMDEVLASDQVQRVDMIKIDAESAELNVLRGLVETIRNFSPKIILEIGDTYVTETTKTRDLIDFMSTRGYETFELSPDYRIVKHELRQNYDANDLKLYNLLFQRKN